MTKGCYWWSSAFNILENIANPGSTSMKQLWNTSRKYFPDKQKQGEFIVDIPVLHDTLIFFFFLRQESKMETWKPVIKSK